MAALAKASGTRLETDPKVAERKITLLIKGADVNETMARIADVMRLRWEDKNGRILLTTDTALENREKAQAAIERSIRQRELRSLVEAMVRWGNATPEARAKEAEAAERRITELQPGAPGWDAALSNYRTVSAINDDRGRRNALAITAIGKEGRRKLLAGEPILASAGERSFGFRLPNESLAPEGPTRPGSEPLRSFVMMLRVTEEGTQLETPSLRVYSNGGVGRRGSSGSLVAPSLKNPPRTALDEESEAWNQTLLSEPLAARRTDTKTHERTSEWNKGSRTDSDRLEWLHDATGVNVAGKADRRRSDTASLRFDGTIQEFVTRWRRAEPQGLQAFFRLEHGFLMMRPARWWERAQEPTEAALRPFESIEAPSFDDWSRLVLALTDRQVAALAKNEVVMRRPVSFLQDAAGLRFWLSLTPDQRAQALRKPMGGRDLTAAQKEAFVRAVLAGSAAGAFSPEVVYGILSGTPSAFDFSAMGSTQGTGEDGKPFSFVLLGFGRGQNGMHFQLPLPPNPS